LIDDLDQALGGEAASQTSSRAEEAHTTAAAH
jgi:hypothetical protein